MKDQDKTKEQLVNELVEMRQRIAELETSEVERVRAEEALRESEERLKLALEAATDGLYDWKVQTGEAYFSPRYYTMLGYEPYEMPASYDAWIHLLHPDDRERAVNTVNEYAEGKRDSHEIEFRLRTKSGGWRWILSRGSVTERDVSGRPMRMVGTHVDITERVRAGEQIRTALREKEVLLREIHHRVKNNLSVVSSLLNLQFGTIEDERVHAALQESQNRIWSMARIHEHLYRSQDLAWVDMAEYIHGLGDFLRRSYGAHAIALKIDAPDVALDIDTAVPCGLIINELVSNAMKYAFPQGQTGEICIALHSVEDRFELVVSDDGVGLPADLDLENLQSLGLKVVSLLTGQLKGSLELDGSDGTIHKIAFPEPTGMS